MAGTGRIVSTALLTPVDRSLSAERVVRQIKDLIQAKHLAPGDRLPNETQLARALDVSRPMVREALRGLAMMGVLEMRGLVHVVSDLTPGRLIAPLSFAVSLSDYTVETLFRSRAVIDPALAADAARHAGAQDVEALRAMVAQGRMLVHDAVAFRALDTRFHGAINRMAANPFLHKVADSLYELGVDVRRVAWETRGVLARSAEDHAAIAAAIAARDPQAAMAAMAAHVAHIRKTTIDGPGTGRLPDTASPDLADSPP